MEKEIGVTVKKDKDFSEWYTQVVQKAELADYSAVKGCMIIKPNGYAIWEKIREYFDQRLQTLDVRNAYFPLFVPESFFKKEAAHAKGFSPEVAWVNIGEGEERVAIRPTSETVMYDAYAKWIRSYRDLPLRINQWNNVVRVETKTTRLFLRTREFLWQEGHCVYETKEECDKETRLILEDYKKLCEEVLAIPVIAGRKTEAEKFAGADYTLTVEALMPDGRALQMGTSHNLGQGFAEAFDIGFLGRDEKRHRPWQNSWGFSTRLIGAIVMVHGDDKGVVLPPRVARVKAVIIPIGAERDKKVLDVAGEVKADLEKVVKVGEHDQVILDDREEYTPGWKFNQWELYGVPVRIEIGPKDVKAKQVILVRRDNGKKEAVKIVNIGKRFLTVLEEIQESLFKKAKKFLEENIIEVKVWDDFKKAVESRKIAKCLFCNTSECEMKIKDETGATSRCMEKDIGKGECVKCGNKASVLIYFSKSY